MNNVFAITSGKGGVGKSTVATCLASACEKIGKKVVLIDLDEGLRCLDVMLGVSEDIFLDISDVLKGENLYSALYKVPEKENLFLLPAPSSRDLMDEEAFGELIKRLANEFDAVFVDFPAGIDMRLYKQMPDTTRFITVTGPDPVSIRDAGFMASSLIGIGKVYNRVIINRFEYSFIKSGIYSGVDDIIDSSLIRLIGIIPNDINLPLAQAKGTLCKKGKSIKAVDRIIRRLYGEDIPLPKAKKI
jgi:septum site-determining protein MinD